MGLKRMFFVRCAIAAKNTDGEGAHTERGRMVFRQMVTVETRLVRRFDQFET